VDLTGSPAQRKLRVVLRPDVTADDVDDAALDLDWSLVGHWDATDERPYEDRYLDPTERTSVSFVDDTYVGLRYLVVSGPDLEPVAAEAREMLPTVPAAEALAALAGARTSADRAAAVPAVALAADPDDRASAAAALREAALEGDDEVRLAVVRASTYVGWPELREVLATLRDSASGPAVRHLAGVALDGLALQDELGQDGLGQDGLGQDGLGHDERGQG
jgi:hypothetical protein